MSSLDDLCVPYDYMNPGEYAQFFSGIDSVSCLNNFEYQLGFNTYLPNEDAWAFAPNSQQQVYSSETGTLAAHCVQNDTASSTTEAQIPLQPNGYDGETPRQEDVLSIIEKLRLQDERLGKLETNITKLQQADPKFPEEIIEIPKQFTEVQSNLETYLQSLMGWTNDQGQAIEDFAERLERTAELKERVEQLETEVEALKDLLYNIK